MEFQANKAKNGGRTNGQPRVFVTFSKEQVTQLINMFFECVLDHHGNVDIKIIETLLWFAKKELIRKEEEDEKEREEVEEIVTNKSCKVEQR